MRRSGFLLLVILIASGSPLAAQDSGMAPFPGGPVTVGTDTTEFTDLLRLFNTRRREFFLPETPAHTVSLHPFLLDRTEVTNAQFAAFLEVHPHWAREHVSVTTQDTTYLAHWRDGRPVPGSESLPVAHVTWAAAIAFCQAAGKRLPIEAEWEVAAAGGLARREFPWGNRLPDSTLANWDGAHRGGPAPVGSYPPTPEGVFDLAGNVWEFVQDPWSETYGQARAVPQDTLAQDTLSRVTTRRVIRGGSYGAVPINLRTRFRDSHPPLAPGPHVGFRCARSAPN
jgi:formylglycine-generating enzyme required for sulfatase activity